MYVRIEEWLGKENQLGIDIWNNKYRHNNETLDEWFERVSGGNQDLKELIIQKKFLLAWRRQMDSLYEPWVNRVIIGRTWRILLQTRPWITWSFWRIVQGKKIA